MTGRLHRIGAVACVLLPLLVQEPAGGAATSSGVASEETSLLYLSPQDWERQPAPRKIALAADFMRIFCADPTMSPASLADCLDRERANGALFERAIACASASAGR
jgi:hypothetical protein